MSMGKLIEEVRKVTTESHLKGSRGSHNRVMEDANAVGVKRMSQSKFDREITELKERLSVVTELLQERDTGGQHYGWKLKRKVEWPKMRLYAKNLKHKFSVCVNEEGELRVAKHEEEVHIMCEPAQDVYLGKKEEDVDTEFTEKLVNMSKSSYQYNEKENGDVIRF